MEFDFEEECSLNKKLERENYVYHKEDKRNISFPPFSELESTKICENSFSSYQNEYEPTKKKEEILVLDENFQSKN